MADKIIRETVECPRHGVQVNLILEVSLSLLSTEVRDLVNGDGREAIGCVRCACEVWRTLTQKRMELTGIKARRADEDAQKVGLEGWVIESFRLAIHNTPTHYSARNVDTGKYIKADSRRELYSKIAASKKEAADGD